MLENEIKDFFGPNRRIIQASSPGRMDVMGGVADYSGSLLLQMPIQERTYVHMAERNDDMLRVRSHSAEEVGLRSEVIFPLQELLEKRGEIVKQKLYQHVISKQTEWSLYVLGGFFLLLDTKEFTCRGADIYIHSEVPFGKGVSSSAAIEVATLIAINALYALKLNKIELPVLAQKVENQVVGAPCGLMDQISSYLGDAGKLLPIICQPITVFDPISIPEEICFVGIDSGVKHAVSGNAYGRARTAAFMGYTVIAHVLRISANELEKAKKTGKWDKLPYQGYLANISPNVFEEKYQSLLPEQISGKEFMAGYKTIIDHVTHINENEHYPVKNCTAHPVYENHRIRDFKNTLEALNQWKVADRDKAMKMLGQWMYSSHESYGKCGLGDQYTDVLVEKVREIGPSGGLYGARITGGGSGGTVCILARKGEGEKQAKALWKSYQEQFNLQTKFFEGSNAGGYYSGVKEM